MRSYWIIFLSVSVAFRAHGSEIRTQELHQNDKGGNLTCGTLDSRHMLLLLIEGKDKEHRQHAISGSPKGLN